MSASAVVRIPVGVLVERSRAESQWVDFLWRPIGVLAGEPTAAPWTVLATDERTSTYYAGSATVELHRGETSNYLDNVRSGAPALWVILRPTGAEPAYEVVAVTADPSEGEGYTEAGNDLVEPVAMPDVILKTIEDFVAEHHVERLFFKRQRDRADPAAMARGGRSEPNDD